jgi:oligopeptide transport system substrate-binding protein
MRALLLGLVLAGCTEEGPFFGRTVPKHGPDELVINLGNEPEYLDPGLASESVGGEMIRNTFAGLVQTHPETLEPIPDIARRWEVSDDGRRYTFHLRRSTWSDGTPLTAHDFEWSWKRLLDPVTGSKYASFGYSILNGAAFNQRGILLTGLSADATEETVKAALEAKRLNVETVDTAPGGFVVVTGGDDDAARTANRERAIEALAGKTLLGAQVDARLVTRDDVAVRAIDDLTLEVRLGDPLPFFLDQLTFYSMRPVPRHVLDRLEREEPGTANRWTRTENWVSNGAYVITDAQFRQYYVLERNSRYWDAEHVRVPRVRYLLVENTNTTLNLYRTADVDWIGQNSVIPNEFNEVLRRYRDLHRHAYLGTYYYWVNVEEPPLDNVLVRRALNLAIDRESLCEHVTRGGQIPTAGLVPDGTAGYRSPPYTLFDPERARALLAEAGYPGGRGLPTITLKYNTSEGHRQIAVAVQEMWRENLGIDVTIQNQEWNVYLKTLRDMDFQVGRMGWIGDYNDPYTFLEVLSRHSGNNHSNWRNDEFQQLIEQANATADPNVRLETLARAEQIAMDELPLIPIYVYARIDMVKPYLRGYWGNLQNEHELKWMWIDERFYDGVPDDWTPEDPSPRIDWLD